MPLALCVSGKSILPALKVFSGSTTPFGRTDVYKSPRVADIEEF